MAKVLVCDDERHKLRLIQVNLERQGYEVVLQTDHRQVLDSLRTGSFDMLVIDGGFIDPTTDEIVSAIFGDPELSAIQVKVLPTRQRSV